MFGKKNKENNLWKLEYFDTVYKIYDWDGNLTGYFFPNYEVDNVDINDNSSDSPQSEYEIEDMIIEKMHKEKHIVKGGNLMLPMTKLSLLDSNEGIEIDVAIDSLEKSTERTKKWKQWIISNSLDFEIYGGSVYTAREDRNMLSIVLGINVEMVLGEKTIQGILKPLLDKLHKDELI